MNIFNALKKVLKIAEQNTATRALCGWVVKIDSRQERHSALSRH